MLPEWPKLSLPSIMEEHFIDTTGFTVCKKCNRTYLGEILKCSCYKGSIVIEKMPESIVQDSNFGGIKNSAKKSTTHHKKGNQFVLYSSSFGLG
jgi:hypothetical protein